MIGNRRNKAPPDATHNFGYGPEIYFWTFVVAVLVMLAGGAVSLAQGIRQIGAPRAIESLPMSLGVLVASAVFEGVSLLVGLKESAAVKRRHVLPGQRVGFWRFIELSKDPNLYETLLEDGAALVGLAIAGCGVLASALLGWLWADGVGSCAIGLLLVANALLILGATRSLIAGEAVAPPFLKDIEAAVAKTNPEVRKVETLHLGPDCVVVALTLARGPPKAATPELDALAQAIRRVDSRIEHVLVRV